MKVQDLFIEYTWLVKTIMRAGKISLEEINEKWRETETSRGEDIPRATFNRHKRAIEDIFGINIDCDASDGYRYYISNKEELRKDSVNRWIISTLSVCNLITESKGIKERILLESVPSETSFLTELLETMKTNARIRIRYRTYEEGTRVFTFDPYCVKLFQRRWYVLGYFGDGRFSLFSLDRIEDMTRTGEHFKMDPDFSAEEYFSEYFGVSADRIVPMERVVIRAFGKEAKMLRDLPVHDSQREVGKGDGYADFELRLRPTQDFTQWLLGQGEKVMVLNPDWLADEIQDIHAEVAEKYTTQ